MNRSDIRKGIYDHLVASIPDVEERVFWNWTAPADSPKPLLEMGFLSDVRSFNNPAGIFLRLEVIVVGPEGDFLGIDKIADDVFAALHHVNILTDEGRNIRPEYRGGSRYDFWYESLKGNAIRQEFWIPSDLWVE